ncbi:MAG: type VII toxin-antitoxin system MntA family adenylyltransferase antitoxin [Actinomycetales bacterium]
MDNADARRREAARVTLQEAGATFAYVFGSVARGEATPQSDLDVAALFPEPAPVSFEIVMPAGVDLLVLNDAPLEIKGKIALDGQLLFEDDPVARVRWEATTRKIYLDERYRIERSHREFLEALGRG